MRNILEFATNVFVFLLPRLDEPEDLRVIVDDVDLSSEEAADGGPVAGDLSDEICAACSAQHGQDLDITDPQGRRTVEVHWGRCHLDAHVWMFLHMKYLTWKDSDSYLEV